MLRQRRDTPSVQRLSFTSREREANGPLSRRKNRFRTAIGRTSKATVRADSVTDHNEPSGLSV